MFVKRFYRFHKTCYFPFVGKCLYNKTTNDTTQVDIAIVGGGIIGYSAAYWLKKENPKLTVAIIERDTSYKCASTVLSVGGLRHQFSVPENIQMSLFCGHVFANIDKYLSTGKEEKIDIQHIKRGYLLLSTKENEDILRLNYEKQRKLGASVEILSQNQIKNNWPWLNVTDIECGVLGSGMEGWFDPWLFLTCVKDKVHQMGIICINGTLKEFQGYHGKLKFARVDHKKGEKEITFNKVINAAGAWASEIAVLAERATGQSGSEYPLFVNKCKRYVYNFAAPKFPSNSLTPMVFDSSGVYFRKENNGLFIAGLSPEEFNEPSNDNLDVDYEWFDEQIWPKLFIRVPSMAGIKVQSGWAGFYDYNIKDQNLIIGNHPTIENFYLCNGSSGHGLQHAIAIGRAIMELMVHGEYQTINLSRFHYNRFLKNELIFEENVF